MCNIIQSLLSLTASPQTQNKKNGKGNRTVIVISPVDLLTVGSLVEKHFQSSISFSTPCNKKSLHPLYLQCTPGMIVISLQQKMRGGGRYKQE